jgi:hypothetical protein
MPDSTENSECRELLDLATPQLYRRNLFRVLGLSVTATPADARRQQKRREMQRKLGVASFEGNVGSLAINPPPTEEEIRVALDRLNDPQARLLDEVFWFWPTVGNPEIDPALEALEKGQVDEATNIWIKQSGDSRNPQVSIHNLAVLDHLTALESKVHANAGDQHDGNFEVWERALARWQIILNGDEYWSRVVIGRAKPATQGRAKTGHFEELEICPLSFAFGSRQKRTVRWRINSRWRKFKQFWHLREADGPTGTSRGNSASTARPLAVTVGCLPRTVQNRPARPSAQLARPPARPRSLRTSLSAPQPASAEAKPTAGVRLSCKSWKWG